MLVIMVKLNAYAKGLTKAVDIRKANGKEPTQNVVHLPASL